MTDLRKDLDKLATHIAKEATKADSLQESTDALKALTAYYAVLVKGKGKGDDADDTTNFGAFSSSINGAEENPNGRQQAPGRRRDS